MGADKGFSQDGEGPVRKIELSPFSIAARATTEAEVFGWTYVFYQFLTPETARGVKGMVDGAPWWKALPLGQHADTEPGASLQHLAG